MKVKTTYLQMFSRPERVVPPPREGLVVVHARRPTVAYYRYLYDAVGRDKDDWSQFLRRALSGSGDERESLHRLLKYGPEPIYWNEFVFKAYHHYQGDAIFLAGIPGLKATLPHA
jgi:hypothetical protein